MKMESDNLVHIYVAFLILLEAFKNAAWQPYVNNYIENTSPVSVLLVIHIFHVLGALFKKAQKIVEYRQYF